MSDRLAVIYPEFTLFGTHHSRFRALLGTGMILSVAASLILTAATGLSGRVVFGLIAVTALSSYALGVTVKLITGDENHTYYHYQVTILTAAILFLTAVGRPVLPYLDLAFVSLTLTQAVGRLGCLMGGCCHGRPARWGVRYAPIYAARWGFPRYLVNVPLIPTQLIESGWAFLTFAAGAALLLTNATPGIALVLVLGTYAVQRFALEFLRGDPARPYPPLFSGTLSEAQCTALVLVTLLALAALAGIVPLVGANLALAAALWIAAARTMRHASHAQLIAPQHVREIARALDRCAAAPNLLPVTTSLGLCLTAPPHHRRIIRRVTRRIIHRQRALRPIADSRTAPTPRRPRPGPPARHAAPRGSPLHAHRRKSRCLPSAGQAGRITPPCLTTWTIRSAPC